MKLVVSSSGDLELPAADSCALDNEEEDEEQCDRIHFKQKGKFFSKLKSIASNKKVCSVVVVDLGGGWGGVWGQMKWGTERGVEYTKLCAAMLK